MPRRKPVNRVLVIPDTHFPFQVDGYLDFLIDIYEKYNCNTVVHLGDLIDSHYSSYHESNPDMDGAGVELQKALDEVRKLSEAFPAMKVCIGNHDAIPARKAFTGGVSKRWVKSIDEILTEEGIDVSGWEFADEHIIDGVKYTHGTGRIAKTRMMQSGCSIIQGHYHGRSSVEWLDNRFNRTFAMQLGALIDDSNAAFAYAKNYADSHHNCGVVIDGKVPIIEYM